MSELRMSAYYYDFEPTGNPHVDNILSAVAWAGKAFHGTDQWTEESHPRELSHRGKTPVEWIQNAAIDAAAALNQQAGLVEALQDLLDSYECHMHSEYDFPGDKWDAVKRGDEAAINARAALAAAGINNKDNA